MGLLKIFLFQAIVIGITECGLLRQPKVYNAVITTDDNLQPSRAFPVVQPVLETGYGGYPFSYLGGYPQFHGNYDFSQFYNKFNQQPQQQFHERNDQPLEQQPEEPNQEDKTDKKTQIPLNDHGLPPSLIPLPTYGNQHHGQQRPIALQPYPFSSYPLTYDPFGGYNQNPYLPPFNGYYPSVPPQNQGTENKEEEEKQTDKKEEPEVEKQEDQKPDETTQKKIDESTEQDVKNITKKDKNIPDVPPPPIPSGGNNKE